MPYPAHGGGGWVNMYSTKMYLHNHFKQVNTLLFQIDQIGR